MIRIEEIVEKVGRNHPQADLGMLRRAYFFSAREHKGQTRASGEPYLVHPLEVAGEGTAAPGAAEAAPAPAEAAPEEAHADTVYQSP